MPKVHRYELDRIAQDEPEPYLYDTGPMCEHMNCIDLCSELCVCGHQCRDHTFNACSKCGCPGFREVPADGEDAGS